jgi:hypothetical protein
MNYITTGLIMGFAHAFWKKEGKLHISSLVGWAIFWPILFVYVLLSGELFEGW